MKDPRVKLPLGVAKYQVCTVKDCGADAITEFYAVDRKGNLQCFGSCAAHINDVRGLAAATALKNHYAGGSAVVAETAAEHTFQVAAAEKEKSKPAKAPKIPQPGVVPVEGVEYPPDKPAKAVKALKAPKEEAPAKPLPVKAPKTPKPIRALKSWTFEEDPGQWCTVEGEVKALTELSDDELMGAASALAHANYQRMRNLDWIKSMDPTAEYVYPEKAIQVGKERAFAKLQEFLQECVKRNLCEPPPPPKE